MDVMAILAIVNKVVLVANTLIQAGKSAKPAIDALINFAKGIDQGPPSIDLVDRTHATLDGLIEQFNAEI